MISSIRKQFNQEFSENKYKQYLAGFEEAFPNAIDFRLAETPIFVDKIFKQKILGVGDYIGQFILNESFHKLTEKSIPNEYRVSNEQFYPECLVMDFAVSQNKEQEIVPNLIELQGFPSLFAFEVLQNKLFRKNFTIPDEYSCYLNGYDESSYITHLNEIIHNNDKHTVLLELHPHLQKTRIDFYCTQQLTNIPIVCLTEIYTKGKLLFYQREGVEFHIERIYNRVVWDELKNVDAQVLSKAELLLQDLEVEWFSHPNHFYRISKYLLPFLQHPFIPPAQFLSQIKQMPEKLEEYILKPLFSFAGKGVIIDLQKKDLMNIKDPENWVLQKKVTYAPIIETPSGPSKAEIRLFYFYCKESKKYIAVNNLTRLSKGKMIGVNYNNTATWVGGSIAYFEKD